MKKIISLLLSLLMLWGCQTSTNEVKLNKHVTLSFFYIETCSECRAFKKNVIPLLEKTFGDQLTINQYDLDDSNTLEVYDQVIDSLEYFDEELYGKGPFVVLDGYFALIGYDGYDDDLILDIERAVNGEELGYELEGLRFLYKES